MHPGAKASIILVQLLLTLKRTAVGWEPLFPVLHMNTLYTHTTLSRYTTFKLNLINLFLYNDFLCFFSFPKEHYNTFLGQRRLLASFTISL